MYGQIQNPVENNLKTVKGYLRSGAVLTLAILNAIALFMTIYSSLSGTNSYMIYDMLREIDYSLASAYAEASSASVITVILSSIPAILTIIAYIVVFAKSRNTNPQSSPIGGVCILYVLALIEMILTIIAVAILGLAFLIAMIATGEIGRSSSSNVAVFIIIELIVFSVAAFFALFSAIVKKKFFGSMKISLTTRKLRASGAGAYGVLNIISAVFTAFGLLFVFILMIGSTSILREIGLPGYYAAYFGVPSFIAMLITLLTYIFNAVVALGYKNHINRAIAEGANDEVMPVYAAPAGYGYAQPTYGYQNPVQNGYVQPTYGYQDTDRNYPQPYTGYQAPVQNPYQQPYSGYQAPTQNEYQQPYGGYQDNGGTYPDPEDDEKTIAADIKTCPSCGAILNGDVPFCGKCGMKLR